MTGGITTFGRSEEKFSGLIVRDKWLCYIRDGSLVPRFAVSINTQQHSPNRVSEAPTTTSLLTANRLEPSEKGWGLSNKWDLPSNGSSGKKKSPLLQLKTALWLSNFLRNRIGLSSNSIKLCVSLVRVWEQIIDRID